MQNSNSPGVADDADDLAYWTHALAGAPPRTVVSLDPAPQAAPVDGWSATRTLDAALTDALARLAAQLGAEFPAVVLASLWTVLARHTGQDDLVVLLRGAAAPAPARVRLEHDPSFTALVGLADASLQAAAAHAVPLTRLQAHLADIGQAFAPQVLLQLGAGGPAQDPWPGALELVVDARQTAGGLELVLRSQRLDAATLTAWLARWEVLLRGAADDPSRPASALPLLSAAELQAELAGAHGEALALPREACVHALVAAQVARTPDAIAVIAEEGRLTYRELDVRARRLAHALQRRGVGPGVIVAICAERSLALMVGLLAILQAGGAYVPLDPEHPAERLGFMLGDTGATLLLTQRHLVAALPAFAGETLLLAIDEADVEPEAPLRDEVTPDDLAYVLYTSGSTGRPKGAMNGHRGFVNRLLYAQQTLPLGPADRVLQKTSCSFDVSGYEFFWPLVTGAALVMARPGGHRDPGYLARVIGEHGVTLVHFVPPMLAVFLELADLSPCRPLRRVLCSGDVLPPTLVRRCHERLAVEVYNLYGPTEAAIDVTLYACRPGEDAAIVPIGRAFANTSIHLLDRHGVPVPPGAPGELHIGGVQVGLGYLNRPELTAASFVQDPFAAAPAARMYRTGDLARRRTDGEIEYLGRIDQQTKIRGVRIELGEIEAALRQQPAVRDAVVVVHTDATGDRQLAAYVVPTAALTDAEQDAWLAELRARLAAMLPESMLPAAFVALAQLPLLASGKVDRKALPRPGERRAAMTGLAPRSATEAKLAEIWASVLGLARCGVEDPFLALGGHSLHAAQILGRVREAFAIEVSFPELFNTPTIARLAALVEARLAAGQQAPRELSDAAHDGPALLASGEQRLYFLHRMAPDSAAYHCPAAFRITGPLDAGALADSLRAVVDRHELLRARFVEVDGAPRRITAEDGDVMLARSELAAGTEDELRRLLELEAARPFDLQRGPPLRAGLVRLGPDDHVFWLVQHHIVSDGWSTAIVLRELAAIYAARRRGEAPVLPALRPHAEHVARQRALASAAGLERWTTQLAGAPHRLELPADRPRPALQSYRGARVDTRVEPEVLGRLRAVAAAQGATTAMALLAGFAALLRRFTGQDDLVVGLTSAARGHVALTDAVGFFVATLPIRIELGDDPSFTALLDRVRARTLAAHVDEAVPFERIVQALQIPRDAGCSPLVQVGFAPQPRGERELALVDATVTPIAVDRKASIFDLTLLTWETEHGGLDVALEYATDLFDAWRIDQLARSFVALLGAAAGAPATPVSALACLSVEQRRQVLFAAQGPSLALAPDGGVHELVAAQARRSPEAVAVGFGDATLTYRELDERAGRLARLLRARGVGPDAPVGIVAERNLAMVVAVLAVLAAGGAYVPLDPDYPQQRLAMILEDAAPRWIVAGREAATRLPPHTAMVIDPEAPESADVEPLAPTRAGQLAYVLFTSGSTGRPKGVAMGHGPLRNLVAWHLADERLGRPARTLQFASLGFDVSAQELLTTWASGGTLVLVADETRRDVLALLRTIEEQAIERLFLPFVMLQHLAEAAMSVGRAPAALRDVITAGEQLKITPAIRWLFTRLPDCALHNHYGPTESHVVTAQVLTGAPEAWPALPAIGLPIAGTRIYLLDARREPVPPGVAGELYIAGEPLARGYLGRPALTAERFLPDPFVAGATMYRTGDLARRDGDGVLEYLGRFDLQVKLRGVRVELGEIEAVLAEHPAVRAAVAAVREDVAGDRRLIAYVVGDAGADAAALRAHLRARLPEAMIPASFVALERLPLLPSGKVDRRALPPPDAAAIREAPRTGEAPGSALERDLAQIWAELLELAPESIGRDDAFFDLGGHSLLLARMRATICARLGVEPRIVDLFRSPTLRSLAAHLAQLRGDAPATTTSDALAVTPAIDPTSAVAIVGMAGRFPGAASVEALWQLLCAGAEGITHFTPEQLAAAGVDPALLRSPRFVPATGVIDDSMAFDAAFFGYSPGEARTLDPQQRVFLECAWAALEDAGHPPRGARERIGVFGGCDVPRYWIERIGAQAAALSMEEYAVGFANMSDTLATRVAYDLGLRGPALTVQTACSTSLVAVHLACQSLRAGECDMALAGGVVVMLPDRLGYVSEGGSVVSPDGHCRPFDADAQGMVSSSGVGLVVLRRLADALADGDTIHAVLRGTAINNDGAQKVGFTAPSVDGQAGAIERALAVAGVEAASVGFVEAHGTATRLGDPIEVAALTRVFQRGGATRNACALGSLKSNLGHLGVAAGVTGLIKATLALARETIPPTLHFRRPNPELELETSPFFVNAAPLPWPRGEAPRRAGVSAFGVGGTNAHAVLEEAPSAPPSGPSRPAQLLVLSAKSDAARERGATRLAARLAAPDAPPLADVAFTLARGRTPLPRRIAVVARDGAAAAHALRTGDRAWVVEGTAAARPPRVAFLFPGGGTQELAMGQALYACEPVYRAAFDRAAAGFDAALALDLRALLFPEPAGREAAARELRRPTRNIAAIFCTEYALALLLISLGVVPSAVTGHSLGEYAAATLAGVLTVEDAVALLVERGRIHEALPGGGALLIVSLSEAALVPRLFAGLDLAAVNAEDNCVVAGTGAAIERLEAELLRDGVEHRRLPVAGASHCALVEPFLPRLRERAASLPHSAPQIPLLSNLSGAWLTDDEARDPGYWARHLRGAVRFADGVARLLADPELVLLEVGPGRSLAGLTRRQPAARGRAVISTLASRDGRRTALEDLQLALGQLWCLGVELDWQAWFAGEQRRRVSLPTYAFERVHHEHPAPPRRGLAPLAPSLPGRSTTTPAASQPELHHDPVTRALAELFSELLGATVVRPADNFFDLGGSSFTALRMRVQIEERLGVKLPLHAFVESPTLGELAQRVHQALPDAAQSQPRSPHAASLRVPLRRGTGPRELFLIQPIGGTVFTYMALARHLDPALTVTGLRASGMEADEPVLTDIEAMAARHIEEIRAHAPAGPYLLGGHSAGGALAFEVARQLRAAGEAVPLVIMLDTPSLALARRVTLTSDDDAVRIAAMFPSEGSDAHTQFAAALRSDPAFRKIVRATWQALAAHEPAPAELDVLYVQARTGDPDDPHPEHTWMALCDGAFTRASVDADHFTMMDEPSVAAVARRIDQAIAQVTRQ